MTSVSSFLAGINLNSVATGALQLAQNLIFEGVTIISTGCGVYFSAATTKNCVPWMRSSGRVCEYGRDISMVANALLDFDFVTDLRGQELSVNPGS
jgi:hypothetical protein